jgi:hypothetical protein
MSNEIGIYSFLPWLRHGIANQIDPASTSVAGRSRATFHISLRAEGEALADGAVPLSEPIERDVELYGPGDIIGIDRRAIIKTESRQWITNFESNYLPYIDFYDEDFPWRYTPEVPGNHRLRPWIMLVVLKEDEFEDGAQTADNPLPSIVVSAAENIFPPIEQLWAWAHVHINRDLAASASEITSTNMDAVMPKFEATLQENPDLAYSRILCPRKLSPSSTYHGFLIPVFESGRMAGLGLDPAGTPDVNHGAWEPDAGKPQPEHFPYYFRWMFQTGTMGDFEYLVRLLEPQPVDSRVGRRDIDVQEPGLNLTGINDADLHGVLRLGGALRVPLAALTEDELAEFNKYENWDDASYPHVFQSDLAAFINLGDDYSQKTVDDAHTDTDYDATIPDPDDPTSTIPDPDPLITPPIYGRWHAMVERVLTERDDSPAPQNRNWVHQLNLDPRHRVAANFGTEVVQQNQETYMRAAWEQIGDVLAANQRIRYAQFARYASMHWYQQSVLPMQANPVMQQRALVLTMPVQRRVISQGVTVYKQVKESIVPRVLVSTEARRIMRPRGRLLKLLPFDATRNPTNLLERVNAGEVTANPAKPPLDGAPTLDELADAVQPDPNAVPPFIVDLLRRFPNLRAILRLIIIMLVVALFLLFFLAIIIVPLIIAAVWFYRKLAEWEQLLAPSEGIREENQLPEVVDRLPKSPDFRLIERGDTFRPTIGTSDSAEAVNFKLALRDAYTLLDASRKVATPLRPTRKRLNLEQLTGTLVTAINPAVTIPRHVYSGIFIPPRIREQMEERFVEAMAYPEIDVPMYEPLVDKSEENFLPNLHLIAQNSISLLETNQAFIEAYMVGLNHEFARELLWREYVTDQRGSYFRQFWDVSDYLHDSAEDAETLREKLRDIPPIHRWSKFSDLGDHDHRETGDEDEEEVVLVIRGELLKKYPTAVIYAHRAKWQRNTDGTIDNTVERELDDAGLATATNPPRDKVKTPLYEAKVDPDIYFFGFDLTVETAVGGTGENETDDPGWFFVIKERPGEPRFGLDIGTAEHIYVWNDLAWGNVVPNTQDGDYIQITNSTPTIPLETPLPDTEDEKTEQAVDDVGVSWHKDTHAAEVAYILYQAPVMVAVHASEMMPRK